MRNLEKPNWQRKKERKNTIVLLAIGLILLVPVGVASAYLLNKTLANSGANGDLHQADPEIKGDRIFVRDGDSFQKALNVAKPGDTILLRAGTTFKGSFNLPRKAGDEFITIRTAALDSQFTPANRRLEPQKYSHLMPKLESNESGMAVITTQNGAHHFRFIGIEFKPTVKGENNIVEIGTGDETKIQDLPHHIEFDRVYIYGDKKYGQRRGIAANGRHIVVKNSHISGIIRKGDESQAIAAWGSDGPITIENNYLEAGGENILFGGAFGPMELTPTNCIVRNNHLNKPLEWKDTDWLVKNLFEIKNGKNIKVQNNLMTNNWAMGQNGTAVLFTVREDSSKKATIENIEFSNNIVRGSGNALNVYGGEGNGGRNLVIKNNIFDDIDGEKWGGSGFFLLSSDWDGLTIENNTIIQTGNITMAYEKPVKKFIFRNNFVFRNEYGIFGDSMDEGKSTLDKFFPGAIVERNAIIGGERSVYGKNNYYPLSIRQIGFKDRKGYQLGTNNPYKNKGSNGKQVGAKLNISEVGRR